MKSAAQPRNSGVGALPQNSISIRAKPPARPASVAPVKAYSASTSSGSSASREGGAGRAAAACAASFSATGCAMR